MKKDDWYQNRILWRAKQHNLLNKRCFYFSDLPIEHAQLIKEKISKDINPVLVFWENQEKWTVLGTRAICSFYDEKFVSKNLDDIKIINLQYPPGIPEEPIKIFATFLKLGESEDRIWAPAGEELFALWNILRMFPLGDKAYKDL